LKDAQRTAAGRVAEVISGHSLAYAAGESDAMVRDLTYGTLRHLGTQRVILRSLAPRGVTEPGLEALLAVGLYQLQHTRAAPYTVVDHAVAAARAMGFERAAAFVNAALRRFLRERDQLVALAQQDPEGRWSHPVWWIDRLRAEYPDAADTILVAGLSHPPMAVRPNLRRTTLPDYRQRLAAEGIEAVDVAPAALLLPKPVPVRRLPGFPEGQVSVQDAGAQWAAKVLAPGDGMRVLDACAAPGGKAAHLLESADIDLTALDADPSRLDDARRNFDRLGLEARCIAADAARVRDWWDGKPFQRVLLDAPCSGSGIVRRHPDARWLRRPGDIDSFAATQRALLTALWQVLEPGGTLLYVTCSVFREENAEVVDAFLRGRDDAHRLPATSLPSADGCLLPDARHDGFFYALLGKRVP
jgi:16S rRNA (cytosine967-C5)-methyltransferase